MKYCILAVTLLPLLFLHLPAHKYPKWVQNFIARNKNKANYPKHLISIMVLMILNFQIVYYACFGHSTDSLIAFILLIVMLYRPLALRFMNRLNASKNQFVILGTVTLGIAFIPLLFPTSVTLAYILNFARRLPVPGKNDSKQRACSTGEKAPKDCL